MRPAVCHIVSHRGGGESFLHQDVPSTVIDVFEAVRTQQNASIPAGHHHHHVPNVQNLW